MSVEARLNALEKQELILSGRSTFIAIHGEFDEPATESIARHEATNGKLPANSDVFIVVRGER